MIPATKVFHDAGTVVVDGHPLHWSYTQTVGLLFYERTEMWSTTVLGDLPPMSYHDLARRCRQKFRAFAVKDVRRKYTESLSTRPPAAQPLPQSQNEN